ADVVSMHLRETPPAPSEVWPDVPPSLERLLLAMLAKDPDERPSLTEVALTLELVRDDLETRTWPHARRRLAAGSTPPLSGPLEPAPAIATFTPAHPTAVRAPARWPWLVAAMLVTGAAAAAIVVIAGRDREAPPRVTDQL